MIGSSAQWVMQVLKRLETWSLTQYALYHNTLLSAQGLHGLTKWEGGRPMTDPVLVSSLNHELAFES